MVKLFKIIFLCFLIAQMVCKSPRFLNENKEKLNQAYQFFDGFFNGTEFYSLVPSFKSCQSLNFELGNGIIDFIEMVRNSTNITSNSTENYFKIVSELGNLVRNLSFNIESCSETPREIKNLFLNISDYLSNPDYFKSFIQNIKTSYFAIAELFARADIFYENKDYYSAGINIGKFVRLLFFPKIDEPNNKINNSINPEIDEIIECLINGMNDPKKYLLFTKEISEILHEKCMKISLLELIDSINVILFKYDPIYVNFTKECHNDIVKCSN
jgi:hypothetical protein